MLTGLIQINLGIEKENKTDRERNDPVTKNRFMGKHKAIFVIEESTEKSIIQSTRTKIFSLSAFFNA